MKDRIKKALCNETGASAIEYIVIISVVIGICTAVAVFGDVIAGFASSSVRNASHIGW